MKVKTNYKYFEKVIKILKDIKKANPDISISRHLFMSSFNDGDNLFYMTDKEMYHLLNKYQCELEMNTLSIEKLGEIIEDDDFSDLTEEEDYEDPYSY